MADASRTLGHETGPDGRLGETADQRPISATALDLARGGGFEAHAEIVQASRAGESDIQRRLQHGRAFTKECLRVGDGQALQEILGGEPRPTREQPMEMESAEADMRGQLGQRRLLLPLGIEVANRPGDAVVVVHDVQSRSTRSLCPPDSCAG